MPEHDEIALNTPAVPSRAKMAVWIYALISSAIARADVVFLQDGTSLKGRVFEEDSSAIGVELEDPRSEKQVFILLYKVRWIDRSGQEGEELQRRRVKLGEAGNPDRVALAEWCQAKGFVSNARLLLLEALRASPLQVESAGIRKGLRKFGLREFVPDGWMTEEELWLKHNFLRDPGGNWVSPEVLECSTRLAATQTELKAHPSLSVLCQQMDRVKKQARELRKIDVENLSDEDLDSNIDQLTEVCRIWKELKVEIPRVQKFEAASTRLQVELTGLQTECASRIDSKGLPLGVSERFESEPPRTNPDETGK